MLPFLASLAASEVTYKKSGDALIIETTDKNDFLNDTKIQEMYDFEGKTFKKVTLTGPITNISANAFNGAIYCESYEIPDTVEYFETASFEQNQALKSITLPKSLKSVGSYAFKDCTSLESVVYYKPTTVFQVEAFSLCTNLKTFEKAQNDQSEPTAGFSYFGPKCFYNCPSLSKIEIPDTLTEIYSECFNGAAALKSIKLPAGLKKISEKCFMGAILLDDIDLTNIVGIGENAFAACQSLKKLTTSSVLREINNSAFESDTSLEDISALEQTENLTVGICIFQGCRSIKTVTIPATVGEIPEYMFSGCQSLNNIVYKGKIFKIGKGAFYDTAFETFTIPSSITVIEEKAFVSMKKLNKFILDGTNEKYGIDEENQFLYSKDSYQIIIYPQGNTQESIKIPAKYKSIGFGAFMYCNNIVEVSFEGEMTDIGNQAFARCKSLSGVFTLPKGLTCVNDKMFLGCSKLSRVVIQNGTFSLAMEVFRGCTSLASVEIPPSLQNMGENCFKGCKSLRSIDCKNTERFDPFVFSGCSSLSDVKISSKCKAINKGLFSYCSSLKTITLSSELTHIYQFAFNCAGLESITIPETCSRIDDHAFNGTNLKKIVFPVSVDEVPMSVLSYTKNLESVEFLGRIEQIGQDAFIESSVKTIKFSFDVINIAYSAFDNTSVESVTYCGSVEVKGRAFQNCNVKPKVYVTDDYPSKTFAAADVTEVNRAKYCEGSVPLPTPTEVPFKNLGKKNFIIIGCSVGGVILVVVLALVFIIPCVMKRKGWAKKETLTESLLTQTV